MSERLCDVYYGYTKPDCVDCNKDSLPTDCEHCRTGCFNVARFKNPNFGVIGLYNYAEWICAEHYDAVIEWNTDPDEFREKRKKFYAD